MCIKIGVQSTSHTFNNNQIHLLLQNSAVQHRINSPENKLISHSDSEYKSPYTAGFENKITE